jgi:hypothetical protein
MYDMLETPDRPRSVVSLVTFSFVSAGLYLLMLLMLWLISSADFNAGGSPISDWPVNPARTREIASIEWVLGLSMTISFLLGIGLLTMHRWVRVVGLVGYILLAIWQLYTIFTATHYYTNCVVLSPVLSIIFVGLLNSRAVRQALQSVPDTRPKGA